MMRLLSFVFAIALFASCAGDKTAVPADIIAIPKMRQVIWDLTRADELVNNFVLKDSSKQKEAETYKMYQQVFAIHHITKNDFYKSYAYYQKHPLLYKTLLDSTFALGTKSRDSATGKITSPQ